MSGSSGSGRGGSTSEDWSCADLRFEAQLTSPQPTVIAKLKVGDSLEVDVRQMKDLVVVQVLQDGEIAGGLVGPDATKLRNCIDQGNRYRAKVRTINTGQVRVLVEHI